MLYRLTEHIITQVVADVMVLFAESPRPLQTGATWRKEVFPLVL